MILRRQRTRRDCGVACVAMLAGVDYERALSHVRLAVSVVAGVRYISTRRGTTTRELARALEYCGLKANLTSTGRLRPLRSRDWRRIPGPALVKIPKGASGSSWHWVVWSGAKIYDPALGVFRPERYVGGQPTSYAAVAAW